MAAQEAQQPQNMEQLEKQTNDESLKKVINEIKELSDGTDKKENDKVELDAILTNEFANTLKANDAKILLEELNKYQIPEWWTAPEWYNDLKNFLEMKANDHPIKESSITGIDNKTTGENISENQKNLINNTISKYFTEKNGDEDNENYINIDKIHWDLKDIKDTLTNIKTILKHPTKENIQKLQQFIYNNLDEGEKQGYLDANKDKQIKPNPTNDKKIVWDWAYGKSTDENLNKFLSKTKDYIKDYQEWKDVADKHTKANEIEQQRIEEQKNRVSKENAEINADNINVTLRWKWKEMNESRLQAEKQQISDKLNSYVQLREYLPKNVQEILCKTRAALESTSQVNDKGDPVSEEVFALENKLNELWFMPKEANDGNNWVDWKFGDKTYDAVINCLESSLKNSAEIDPKKITVKLRWKWKNMDENKLKDEIRYIAEDLNWHRDNRENLTYNQKKVLILTKAALESTSNSEDKSEAVLALENELNNLWFMPKEANDGNNWVDWKFGDKTYCAIIDCLDGQKPQFLKWPEKTNTPTWTVSETTEGKKWPKTLKDVFDALLNIDWQSWWWFEWFLNNIKNRFNALTWWTGNIDKFKDNNTIDFDNQTVKDVLAQIQTTKDIIWIKTIKKTLETGKEKDIRELQMALWTPDNWLNITGKIDEQTAKILKKYIENEDNKWSWDNLEDQCLKGFQKENDTAINIWEKIQWFIYAKTDWYWQTTRILKWTIDWKACIAANINYTAGEWNNSAKISGEQSIIQYLDWTKEVWKFDGDLKLIEWTRYSGGKKEKVPATANQNTTDGASSGATGATTTPATETTKTAQQ